MDYGLCNQTVSVYSRTGGRRVFDGCHYEFEARRGGDITADWQERKFLLIVPGNCQVVFPGDKVCPGVGPELDWDQLTPEKVPGLSVAQYAGVCYWGGQVCHTEAGRK